MTQQFDMLPGELVDVSVLERIDAKLPKVREVRAPRLPSVLPVAETTGEEMFRAEPHEVKAQ